MNNVNTILTLILYLALVPTYACKESGNVKSQSQDELTEPDANRARAAKEGMEDYHLVREGHLPRYAQKVTMLFDGGTKYYRGHGYTLIVVARISGFDREEGYIYGPIIVFDHESESITEKIGFSLDYFDRGQFEEWITKKRQP